MTDNFQDINFKNIRFNKMSKKKLQQMYRDGRLEDGQFYITNDAFQDNAGGLDVLDIGQSLYIDESQGLRRYLNGSWVDINDHTKMFYERLMKACTLNPNLVCTNEEYESILSQSPFGQCGKFVIDTVNGRIRLPKVVYSAGTLNLATLGDIDNGRILVVQKKPTGTDMSWYNWYSDGWLEQGNTMPTTTANAYYTQAFNKAYTTKPQVYIQRYSDSTADDSAALDRRHTIIRGITTSGFNVWGTWGGYAYLWRAEGYTNRPTPADINASNSGITIRYPYYIQIATGLDTVINITEDVQLNNPYTLGESKYSPIVLNNTSWLSSAVLNNPRSAYPSYYDMLLRIYKGELFIEGITVKAKGDTTITRLDHVIDVVNETFDLPTLNGTENVQSNVSDRDLIPVGGTYYGFADADSPILKGENPRYTAPYNGWYYLEVPYEENKDVDMYNYTTGIGTRMSPASSGTWVCTTIYANKGDVIGVWTTGSSIHRFEFHVAKGNGNLYYYVGDTVKNADIINAGKYGDIVASQLDGRKTYYVEESWRNGKSFYRKYSDGWCEQGGQFTCPAVNKNWGTNTLQFHTPFKDADWNLHFIYGIVDGANGNGVYVTAQTKSSCTINAYNCANTQTLYWYACGYWK